MSAVEETSKPRSSSLDGESYPEEKPRFRKQRRAKAPLSKIISALTESENEANEEKHREHFDCRLFQSVWLLPEILELKLPVDHHKDFEEGFGEMVEGVALWSKVDDVESESEGREEDEESENRCDQSLDHRVKHQREVAP